MILRRPLIHIAALVAAGSLATAQQPSIYIDFGDPAAGFGAPDTSFVAVASSPGLWNAVDLSIPGSGGSFISGPLLDTAGGATGVNCTLSGAGTPVTLFAADAAATSGNDQALLDDCVRFGGAGSLVLDPLPAGDYNVYVFGVAPDEDLDPGARTTRIEVPGSVFGPQGVTGGFFGAYDSGTTHSVHRVTLDGVTVLNIQVEGSAGIESVNGIQIVPAAVSLMGGTTFCSANPNSTGAVGTLGAFGLPEVVANDLTLRAGSMPPGEFGIFVASQAAGGNVPINQGNLCLTGPTGRFQMPGQIFQADAAGRGSLVVDLRALPTATGILPATPGGTWHFQAWHRDVPPSGSFTGSNFTEGVSVTFI